MVTTAMMTLEDGDRAREVFRHNQNGYHTSLVAKYLDSFPQAAGIDKTPTLTPPIPLEQVNQAIEMGAIAVGTPEEAINTMRVYEAIGADQVSFGVAVRRHAVRRRRRVGRDVRQVRAARVRQGPGALDDASTRGAGQLAGHSGGRFSRNAAMPSWASASAALAAITGCTRS